MAIRFYLIFFAALTCLLGGNVVGQVVVDGVTLAGQVSVTNNANEIFTDSFLVNDFDNSDAVRIETDFLRPLPEFHSSALTVEATRLVDGFQVFANAFADVNFNIFEENLVVGGAASASGLATIDFTLASTYLFTLFGATETDDFTQDVQSTSTVSLTQVTDAGPIDLLTDTSLAPGSYRFSTTIDLTVSPIGSSFDDPPLIFGEAFGDVFAGPSLRLTAVPEPSTSILTGLSTGLIFFRRRRQDRIRRFSR